MSIKPIKLCVVLPVYNEQEILSQSVSKLLNLYRELIGLGLLAETSFLALVDDGSSDNSWNIIEALKADHGDQIRAIKLASNAGHQFALLSGLLTFYKESDCTISIDADLQDDIDVIKDMLQLFNNGFEIVYGVRKQRATDTFFKRITAEFFYKFMIALGVKIVYNHADYRLSSSRVVESLSHFGEVNLFLRGIYPLIGFKSANVYYDRKERVAGESKYPLRKMLSFAWEGITSFSIRPLRFIFYSGLIIFAASLFVSVFVFYSYFVDNVIRGWSSLLVSIYFIGSIQLMSIGIIGDYVGKIYKETKRRPRFIIDKVI